jgi:hypothetical protein
MVGQLRGVHEASWGASAAGMHALAVHNAAFSLSLQWRGPAGASPWRDDQQTLVNEY